MELGRNTVFLFFWHKFGYSPLCIFIKFSLTFYSKNAVFKFDKNQFNFRWFFRNGYERFSTETSTKWNLTFRVICVPNILKINQSKNVVFLHINLYVIRTLVNNPTILWWFFIQYTNQYPTCDPSRIISKCVQMSIFQVELSQNHQSRFQKYLAHRLSLGWAFTWYQFHRCNSALGP